MLLSRSPFGEAIHTLVSSLLMVYLQLSCRWCCCCRCCCCCYLVLFICILHIQHFHGVDEYDSPWICPTDRDLGMDTTQANAKKNKSITHKDTTSTQTQHSYAYARLFRIEHTNCERIFIQVVYWISFLNNKSFSQSVSSFQSDLDYFSLSLSLPLHCPLSIGIFLLAFLVFRNQKFEWINRLSCVYFYSPYVMCGSNKCSIALLYCGMLNPFGVFDFFSRFSANRNIIIIDGAGIFISIRASRVCIQNAKHKSHTKLLYSCRSHTNTSYTRVCVCY